MSMPSDAVASLSSLRCSTSFLKLGSALGVPPFGDPPIPLLCLR